MRTTSYYILNEKKIPIPEKDVLKWGRWMEKADRYVASDHIKLEEETIWVSTVFLGIDHSFQNDLPPILFETMIFFETRPGSPGDECWRWRTWKEAEQGHKKICKKIRSQLINLD